MTAPIIIELGFRGIHIPPGESHVRTHCPDCSDDRRRPHRRTLCVRLLTDTEAETICRHCGTPGRIRA
jgi:hypothetical protein